MEQHRCGSDFPPLSPTIQASQLLTPLQLERLSIDDPHYSSHLRHSVIRTQPPQHNAVQRRLNKMGDNYFFLQKDIPVNQSYAKTALQLSEVRPWDQIVDRPMASHKVVEKELQLPFPQEHPYTSHISRFAVFPHTNQPPTSQHSGELSQPQTQSDEPTSVSVETQTGPWVASIGVPKPNTPYYVSQKASEWGQRVEYQYLASTNTDRPERSNGMLWDLPRSQRHKRAYTYPAPSLQYGKPLMPPSAVTTSSQNPVSPNTLQALNSIHTLLTRTTTYTEQFYGSATRTTHTPNILSLDTSFRSHQSQRPWTADSRGKYSRRLPTTPFSAPPPKSPLFHNEPAELGTRQPQLQIHNRDKQDDMREKGTPSNECDHSGFDNSKVEKAVKMKFDAATQTEDEYFCESDSTHLDEIIEEKLPSLTLHSDDTKPDSVKDGYKLPQISQSTTAAVQGQSFLQQVVPVQPVLSNRPTSAFTHTQHTEDVEQLRHKRSLSANDYIPRRVDSARRLNTLYNGFSRTETLKRFREEYPENAPDLRHYSIREGKRHIIHGSHAYYFH